MLRRKAAVRAFHDPAFPMKPMKQPSDTSRSKVADDRKARLAQELRANLQKRKAQSRHRKASDASERSGAHDPDEPQLKP